MKLRVKALVSLALALQVVSPTAAMAQPAETTVEVAAKTGVISEIKNDVQKTLDDKEGFSRKFLVGLMKKLNHQEADINQALDEMNIDYKEQARLRALKHIEVNKNMDQAPVLTEDFLMGVLMDGNGFTKEQAAYAVKLTLSDEGKTPEKPVDEKEEPKKPVDEKSDDAKGAIVRKEDTKAFNQAIRPVDHLWIRKDGKVLEISSLNFRHETNGAKDFNHTMESVKVDGNKYTFKVKNHEAGSSESHVVTLNKDNSVTYKGVKYPIGIHVMATYNPDKNLGSQAHFYAAAEGSWENEFGDRLILTEYGYEYKGYDAISKKTLDEKATVDYVRVTKVGQAKEDRYSLVYSKSDTDYGIQVYYDAQADEITKQLSYSGSKYPQFRGTFKRVTDKDKVDGEDVKPIEDDKKPIEDDKKPIEDDKKPVEDDKKPSEDDKKPVEDDKKPSEDDKKPVEDDKKPVEDDKKPVEDDKKPSEDDKKPVEDHKKPVEELPGKLPFAGGAETALPVLGSLVSLLGAGMLRRKQK